MTDTSASTSTVLDDVRAWVAGRERELLAELCAYVDCRGVSATGEGIAEAGAHVSELLRRANFAVEPGEGGRHPFVIGRSEPDPAKPTVLIYGHYDVQPPGPPEAWVTPAFQTTVRDGRVWGRGVADNKGQHLVHVLAVTALRELYGELPCNVIFLLDGEEEIGSPGLPAFARANAERLRADVALWSDGPVEDDAHPCVSYGVRGAILFELHVPGSGRALHSGNWGNVAPNPAWTLAWLLASMQAPDGTILVEGFHDGVLSPGPLEREALASMDARPPWVDEELGAGTPLAPAPGGTVAERLALHPTLTINALRTGDGAGEARPIVPGGASALCDVRLVPGQRVDHVIEALRRHVERFDPRIRLELSGSMEPSATPMDAPYSDAVRAAVEAATGQRSQRVPALGGGLPLHSFTDILGMPCYGVPIANRDELNHSPNENLEVARFLQGIVTSAGILERIAAAGRA
jgi:acetylornithine deacetylase/succinyl-diaminopimelate desuccinylase-like protein